MEEDFKKIGDLFVFNDRLIVEGISLTIPRFFKLKHYELGDDSEIEMAEVEFILEPDKHFFGSSSKTSVDIHRSPKIPFFITQAIEWKKRFE